MSASQWLVTTRKPQKNKRIWIWFVDFIFIEYFCKLSFASNPTWIKHRNLNKNKNKNFEWLSGVFNQGKQLNCLFDKFHFWNYSSINSFTKMYKINLYVYSINYFPVNIFEFIKFLPLSSNAIWFRVTRIWIKVALNTSQLLCFGENVQITTQIGFNVCIVLIILSKYFLEMLFLWV